jgi:hypothetical protein
MKIKGKLPFVFTKDFWQGDKKQKEIAKAKYTLAGEELEKKLVELEDMTDTERQIALLGIDKKYGKLSDVEHDKQVATINDKPYVGVLKTNFDPTKPKNGWFELDWNQKFIDDLVTAGYTGEQDEDVVNKWFNDLCRNVMMEEMDQDVMQELKDNIKENKNDLGDGKVEYS